MVGPITGVCSLYLRTAFTCMLDRILPEMNCVYLDMLWGVISGFVWVGKGAFFWDEGTPVWRHGVKEALWDNDIRLRV